MGVNRRALSRRVYAVEYRHAKDGRDYRHDFRRGVDAITERDGTVRLESATGKKLYEDFGGQRFLVNPPRVTLRQVRAAAGDFQTQLRLYGPNSMSTHRAEWKYRETQKAWDRQHEPKGNPVRSRKRKSKTRNTRRRRNPSARPAKRRRAAKRQAVKASASSSSVHGGSMARRKGKRRRNPAGARRTHRKKHRRHGMALMHANPHRHHGRKRSFRRNPSALKALGGAALGGLGVTAAQIGTIGLARLIPPIAALGTFEAIAKQILSAGVITLAAEKLIGGEFGKALGYGAFSAPWATVTRQFAPVQVSSMLGEYDRCRTAGYVRGYVPGRRPTSVPASLRAYTPGAPPRKVLAPGAMASLRGGSALDSVLHMDNMM